MIFLDRDAVPNLWRWIHSPPFASRQRMGHRLLQNRAREEAARA